MKNLNSIDLTLSGFRQLGKIFFFLKGQFSSSCQTRTFQHCILNPSVLLPAFGIKLTKARVYLFKIQVRATEIIIWRQAKRRNHNHTITDLKSLPLFYQIDLYMSNPWDLKMHLKTTYYQTILFDKSIVHFGVFQLKSIKARNIISDYYYYWRLLFGLIHIF